MSEINVKVTGPGQISANVTGGVGPQGPAGPSGPGGTVDSVNGQTGTVVLTSLSVSAASALHTHTTSNIAGFDAAAAAAAPVQSVAGRTGVITLAVADVANAVSDSDGRLSDSRTPLAHTHAASDVTSGTFDVARIPTHTHSISQVDGLQTSLDGKASVAATNVSRVVSLNGLTGTLTIESGSNVTVATSGSSITISAASGGGGGGAVDSVNGQTGAVVLTSLSVSAASAVHTHVVADITDLAYPVSSVNGQTGTVVLTNASVSAASAVHTHLAADVLDFTSVANVVSVNGLTGVVTITAASQTVASVGSKTLTQTVDNYDAGTTDIVRLSGTANYTITGLSGGSDGVVRVLLNVGTNDVTIASQSTASDAANRLLIRGGDRVLREGESLPIFYDVADSRWRPIAREPAAISSVNGQTGAVVITTLSLSAASATHTHVVADVVDFTNVANVVSLNGLTGTLTIQAGDNVTVSTSGSSITIAAGGGGGGGGAVDSVNGQTGTVVLTSESVSAASAVHSHYAADIQDFATEAALYGPVSSVNGQTGVVVLDLSGGSAAVSSVNGQTGTVVLTSESVSAASAVHSHYAADIQDFAAEAALYGPVSSVNGQTGTVVLDLTNLTSVVSLNGLTGTLTIQAGDNITVSTSGSTITIAGAAGGGGGGGAVDSVNGQTGTVVISAADITAAAAVHGSQHQTGGSDPIANVVTAVSLTASVDNYSLPVADIFRLSHTNTVTVNITGFATATDGEAKLLVNVSTGASSSYTLKHANTNSTAVSRLLVPWEGDYVLSPNGGAALVIYDDTDDRWRVV